MNLRSKNLSANSEYERIAFVIQPDCKTERIAFTIQTI